MSYSSAVFLPLIKIQTEWDPALGISVIKHLKSTIPLVDILMIAQNILNLLFLKCKYKLTIFRPGISGDGGLEDVRADFNSLICQAIVLAT